MIKNLRGNEMMPRSKGWLWAIGLCLSLMACNDSGRAGVQGTVYAPDSEIQKVFPRLPQPLWSQVQGESLESSLSISFPENYNTTDRFPLFIWLGGGSGGAGDNVEWARSITQNRDFVCVNLPLYKQSLAPLAADQSNAWSRIIIQQEDSDFIWRQYQVLFRNLFRLVPNLDREHIFLGGFSNGANTIAVLLNNTDINLFPYINHFILVEGGNSLSSFSRVNGSPLLIIEGDQRMPRFFEIPVAAMQDEHPTVEYILMEETGHEFPERYQEQLRQWMLAQVQGR